MNEEASHQRQHQQHHLVNDFMDAKGPLVLQDRLRTIYGYHLLKHYWEHDSFRTESERLFDKHRELLEQGGRTSWHRKDGSEVGDWGRVWREMSSFLKGDPQSPDPVGVEATTDLLEFCQRWGLVTRSLVGQYTHYDAYNANWCAGAILCDWLDAASPWKAPLGTFNPGSNMGGFGPVAMEIKIQPFWWSMTRTPWKEVERRIIQEARAQRKAAFAQARPQGWTIVTAGRRPDAIEEHTLWVFRRLGLRWSIPRIAMAANVTERVVERTILNILDILHLERPRGPFAPKARPGKRSRFS